MDHGVTQGPERSHRLPRAAAPAVPPAPVVPPVGAAYDGGPGTIGAARDFATGFLRRAQADHGVPVTDLLVEDVRLVVSELVTNAAKYAPGPCLLDLEFLDDALRVTLWDTDTSLPVPALADPGRIGRHGLEIVVAVCRRFEVERQAGGKRVRVDLAF
ncbi:ATP-binding protein [Streptacidiphilus cavernicola]|uniref:ATP-binding protein n=1 Tax=Streptacidiphilus cavernicola TaxID=3342716 RepID=A0ABV6W3B9_9ACTN